MGIESNKWSILHESTPPNAHHDVDILQVAMRQHDLVVGASQSVITTTTFHFRLRLSPSTHSLLWCIFLTFHNQPATPTPCENNGTVQLARLSSGVSSI